MNLKNWRRRFIKSSVLAYYYMLRSEGFELLALFQVDFRLPRHIFGA